MVQLVEGFLPVNGILLLHLIQTHTVTHRNHAYLGAGFGHAVCRVVIYRLRIDFPCTIRLGLHGVHGIPQPHAQILQLLVEAKVLGTYKFGNYFFVRKNHTIKIAYFDQKCKKRAPEGALFRISFSH